MKGTTCLDPHQTCLDSLSLQDCGSLVVSVFVGFILCLEAEGDGMFVLSCPVWMD